MNINQYKYNAVIIGSGIAGLYTTLKLEQNCSGTKILLITKSTLGESNSYYAQGGMVAVLKDNKNDNVASHVNDTLIAGAGLSDENTVKFISENSDKVVKDLLKFGVIFDKDENGAFKLTKEAAHSVNRILHSYGDATGREIEKALVKAIRENENIEIYENTTAVDLIVEKNICKGLIVLKNTDKYHNSDNYERINSDVVILATGGLGQIFRYTTNPLGATGDGLALAYRAGAVLRDMEFVQFHPTALAIDDSEHHNRFLISEAVRGEGAKLCDKNNYYYMEDYDKRAELAPRDIVARANFTQMQKTNSNCVYLDAGKINNPVKRFPTISKKCAQYGINIEKDLIPVAPAAHYFMGGVKTDLNGKTSVENLFAIGETASTGLHGANRLASNSLLECVVCAYYTAEYLKKNTGVATQIYKTEEGILQQFIHSEPSKNFSYEQPQNNKNANYGFIKNLKIKLKNTMWQNVGIYRNEHSLNTAFNDIEKIEKIFNKPDFCRNTEEYELRNMIIVSKLLIKSALQRKESRGAHYRTDYTQTNITTEHSELNKFF